MARHGGVQRREAILLEQIMEGGDVTESDEPFGMLPELGKIQFAYQMHGSVTAPTTEYDFGFFIVHGILQVLEALPDISCIRSVGTPRVLCEYDFQPPGLQTFVGAFQERFVNLAGRGENNDTITFLQIRRENKTTHIILSIYFGQKYTIHHRYHRLTRIFNRREGGHI